MTGSGRAALLAMVCVLAAGAAHADHCAGPEDRPAVCTVDFYGAFAGERSSGFDPARGLDLPPGQTFQIELEALDQHRRRFPSERLAFDFDAGDCRGFVDVEQIEAERFELRATGRHGHCDLWMWIPGDLNLEWRLELRAVPRQRSGYSRGEAEILTTRLYRALLGREPEPQALSDTSIEIQRGNLEARTLDMLRSAEYQSTNAGKTPPALLEQLYAGIFDRKPDTSGVRAFLPLVQRGQTAVVIRELVQSDEFEKILSEATLGEAGED